MRMVIQVGAKAVHVQALLLEVAADAPGRCRQQCQKLGFNFSTLILPHAESYQESRLPVERLRDIGAGARL